MCVVGYNESLLGYGIAHLFLNVVHTTFVGRLDLWILNDPTHTMYLRFVYIHCLTTL